MFLPGDLCENPKQWNKDVHKNISLSAKMSSTPQASSQNENKQLSRRYYHIMMYDERRYRQRESSCSLVNSNVSSQNNNFALRSLLSVLWFITFRFYILELQKLERIHYPE